MIAILVMLALRDPKNAEASAENRCIYEGHVNLFDLISQVFY